MATYTLTWHRTSTGLTASQEVSEPEHLEDDQPSDVDTAIEGLMRDADIDRAWLVEKASGAELWTYIRV